MGPSALLKLAIVIICILFSGYFSATETAFSTFNRIRIKNLAEKGNKRAARVLKLSEDYDTLITTILIGNNIVNILSTSIGTLLFIELLGDPNIAATVSTVVLTVAVLIFGEISPKTLAKKRPEAFALFAVHTIMFFKAIFIPFIFIFKGWQKLLSLIVKPDDDAGITEEELISIIEEAEEEGDIDKEESTLIKSAIEFNDLEVSNIFTPRIDITAVSSEATKEEVSKVFSESGYSRLPVYEGSLDNIIGILYYKDFFNIAFKYDIELSSIIKPVLYVVKTQKINDLLKDLQNKQMHLAVVLDEYGSTAGIVTLEDIIEEIVGEIWDEHDEKVLEYEEISEKEYIVVGMMSLPKMLNLFDIDEEVEAANVNGWCMEILGKMPEEGDCFESLGLAVKILETNGKRVEKVHVSDVRPDEEEEEESVIKKWFSSDDKDDEDKSAEEDGDGEEMDGDSTAPTEASDDSSEKEDAEVNS